MTTRPANHSPPPEEPTGQPEMGRVLRFEPRRGSQRPRVPLPPIVPSRITPLDQGSADTDDTEDYRHRMRANLAAILVVAALIGCGYWLFGALAEMRRNQDCIMSGRTNCVQINVLPDAR